MRFHVQILFVALFVFMSHPVFAEKLYKVIDEEGNVSYQSMPPTEGAGYQIEEKDISDSEVDETVSDAMEAAAERAPVVLYSVAGCDACNSARAYLTKRGIPFTEKNANKDVATQKELKKRTGSLSIPTILVGEKVMKGYLKSILKGELDAAGYPKEGVSPAAEEGQ